LVCVEIQGVNSGIGPNESEEAEGLGLPGRVASYRAQE
jgi:hypothetical protein